MSLGRWQGSRAVRSLFWAAALFAFIMAVLPHPPRIPGNPEDKVQHVAAFATMAALGAWGYPRVTLTNLLIRLSLFGATIEVVQSIKVLHRDSDILDWVADTIAVTVVLLAVFWWRRRAKA